MGLRVDLGISVGESLWPLVTIRASSVGGGPSDEQHRGMACAAAKEGEHNGLGGDENFGQNLGKPDQRKTDPHLVLMEPG